ncbi:MAG: mevalonate kinase family protein [Thermoplasmata archaeon]
MSGPSDGIAAHPLPLSARAPGKCILFGEHAVVHGAPELLFAIDLDTQMSVRPAESSSLNGDPAAAVTHPYLRAALERCWTADVPLHVRAVSRIPKAAGLGSSAAFVAALGAVLAAARGGIARSELAQRSFDVERGAQGVGSPGDTSASVAGGYITINSGSADLLWEVSDGLQRWAVRRASDPGWTWVIAYSGIPRSTADAVRAVGTRLAQADGPELLEKFRRVAEAGIRAVASEDRIGTATAMNENHELLVEAGVSHPRLEELIRAAAPAALASKLTGAGAGGSIVTMPVPGKEAECVRRLARAGGLAFAVRPARHGAGLLSSGG